MDYRQKVLWTEGMFLTPQHFQQWDRYHEHLLWEQSKSVQALGWGVRELKIDEDALSNGELVVTRASLVFPDGSIIDIPEGDAAPQARPVESFFGPKQDHLGVYLALPMVRPGAVACAGDGDKDRLARFRRKDVRVNDESTGTNERQITSAVKNIRILFEGEPLEDYVWIKAAEIVRGTSGTYGLGETYVPPCLYLGASSGLLAVVRGVLEALSTKSADLATQRRQRSHGLVEFTMSEAGSFWLLHTVNGYIPILLHFFHQPRVHPERVYMEMARMAGELHTFAAEGHPKDLPLYVHDDPGACFRRLADRLRDLMGTVVPTRCANIALERTRDSLFTGKVPDERLLDSAQFYFAVAADVPEEKITREVPIKAKISSRDRVDLLIAQAIRGLALKHMPTPPTEIPVQPGRCYFQLEKSGDHWEAVRTSKTISIYIPPEFAGLKLELMAVKE